jgi:hypothetical protein
LFLHLLTCVYIIWATFPNPHPSATSWQNPLVLRFPWRKNTQDKKEKHGFFASLR